MSHPYAIHNLPKDSNGAPMAMGSLAKVLNIMVLIASTISGICSYYIIRQWWLIRHKASFNFRILVYTIIGEVVFQTACAMGCVLRLSKTRIREDAFECQGLGFLVLYAVAVMTQWISCVALNSYFAVVRQVRLSPRQELYCHIWCWGSPLIYMTIPFWGIEGTPKYGFRNEAWCAIRSGTPVGFFLMCMGLFLFPAVVMGFSYGSIIMMIRRNTAQLKAATQAQNTPGLVSVYCPETADQSASPRQMINNITSGQMRVMWTMIAYLLAYLITWIPALIDFAMELRGHDYITPPWLELFATGITHTTGTINYIVYSRTHNSSAYKDNESTGASSQGTKGGLGASGQRKKTVKSASMSGSQLSLDMT
ncbi:hypothetical protein BC832DRAFT_355360 [Gaertneriomyces semiglobifer]|nr:hypothetical protein BC832DRAFT_355360 [Gaertneriomyces semiglobifer]